MMRTILFHHAQRAAANTLAKPYSIPISSSNERANVWRCRVCRVDDNAIYMRHTYFMVNFFLSERTREICDCGFAKNKIFRFEIIFSDGDSYNCCVCVYVLFYYYYYFLLLVHSFHLVVERLVGCGVCLFIVCTCRSFIQPENVFRVLRVNRIRNKPTEWAIFEKVTFTK